MGRGKDAAMAPLPLEALMLKQRFHEAHPVTARATQEHYIQN